MPGFRALSSALAAAACAAALSACGGDDEGGPIPEDRGNQLLAQLEEIESEVDAGDCDRAHELALSFAEDVSLLSLENDPELREALVSASANLEELTTDPDQCMPDQGTTGETGTVPTTPETTTTTTTTEPATTTPPEEPKDEEDNGGGPPDEPPGGSNGDPGGGNGNDDGGGDSSGGIGSDG